MDDPGMDLEIDWACGNGYLLAYVYAYVYVYVYAR